MLRWVNFLHTLTLQVSEKRNFSMCNKRRTFNEQMKLYSLKSNFHLPRKFILKPCLQAHEREANVRIEVTLSAALLPDLKLNSDRGPGVLHHCCAKFGYILSVFEG
jgi:hypothetical protein